MTSTHAPRTDEEIQVVVVDDHPAVRRGLELLLPKLGFRVTGSAGSVAEATRLIAMRQPAVAGVDVGLPDGRGTRLGDFCAEASPRTQAPPLTGVSPPAP